MNNIIIYISNVEKLFLRDVPLKAHCTYGVGGPAAYYFEPASPDEMQAAVSWAWKSGTPLFVLGRGSNVLVSDKGFQGLVLCTAGRPGDFTVSEEKVEASCGADLGRFVEACCGKGFSGMADLYDIPGTVGGAVYMNAGAFDSVISFGLREVLSLDRTGRAFLRKRDALFFDYRNSTFRQNGEIILTAAFSLERGDPEILLSRMRAIKARRDEKQPPDRDKSCGSVFKRPPGGFAGTLIEKAGCKGLRIGGAKVSEKHADFIINDNQATASDIKALIELVQKKTQDSSGILLEPEVVFLGEF